MSTALPKTYLYLPPHPHPPGPQLLSYGDILHPRRLGPGPCPAIIALVPFFFYFH